MSRTILTLAVVLYMVVAGATCGQASGEKGAGGEPAAQAAATQPAATQAQAEPAADPTAEYVEEAPKQIREPDVIFVPTPLPVVEKMLELAQVDKDDLVYDLGCGNGAIVVAAAKKYGCKAIGFDINPVRIEEARKNVQDNNVGELVKIIQRDIFTLDLSPANVVTLYLLPSLNVKLIPQLEKLKPGTHIVSHDFDMDGIKPDEVVQVEEEGGRTHNVYHWTTPLKRER